MENILKHLFLPITMALWYLITFYLSYYVIRSLVWIFDMYWLWLFVLEMFIIALGGMLIMLVSRINKWFLEFIYSYSWLALICHSLVSLYAIVSAGMLYNSFGFSISLFFDVSWFKSILLFIPVVSLFLGLVNVLCIYPFIERIEFKKMRSVI